MKTIAIFTTTRAEFGIFSALLREMDKVIELKYKLFVGGSHLAVETGTTINEIRNSEFLISDTFDYQLNESNDATLSKSIGYCTIELANIFKNHNFDFVCVLGDRLELLPIVTNAIVFGKPIIHIHGGEQTEGAIDEQIRHMVTKASHIHFASCEEYAINIINMGEAAWRVHNVGALAVDNILNLPKVSKNELFKQLKLDIQKPTVLFTYHPVTLELDISSVNQIKNVFEAIKPFDYQVVITSPNADKNRDVIFEYINSQITINKNYRFIESLGVINYLSLIPFCSFVIGNSSSAIIEVPFFKVPVVNIGNRQKGRIFHENIISCDYSISSIKEGIETAISHKFINRASSIEYKFGAGKTAEKIIKIISDTLINKNLLNKQLVFPY